MLFAKISAKECLASIRFDENPKDDIPPTTALDFQYTTKIKDDKKLTINVYELGGGRILSSMLSSCLTEESI